MARRSHSGMASLGRAYGVAGPRAEKRAMAFSNVGCLPDARGAAPYRCSAAAGTFPAVGFCAPDGTIHISTGVCGRAAKHRRLARIRRNHRRALQGSRPSVRNLERAEFEVLLVGEREPDGGSDASGLRNHSQDRSAGNHCLAFGHHRGPGVDWLSQFLQMGGGQYVDVIGYHFYVAPQPPEAMIPLIERVKQVTAENGVGDKPLWNTECAWPSPRPFPSEDLAAGYLARAYILNWAAGVQRFYWYAWDNHIFDVTQTTRQDNQTLTPAGRAYGIIQKWLVGARVDTCSEASDQTWTCQLTRNSAPGSFGTRTERHLSRSHARGTPKASRLCLSNLTRSPVRTSKSAQSRNS